MRMVLLVLWRKRAFLAEAPVILASAQVVDDHIAQQAAFFVGHIVQQVGDSPCHPHFVGGTEQFTFFTLLGITERVYHFEK